MRRKFIIIVLFQVLLLVGIIAYRQYWVATGERVLLGTEPVDPRDIFRGDYVTLNYEISSLDLHGPRDCGKIQTKGTDICGP